MVGRFVILTLKEFSVPSSQFSVGNLGVFLD
jgi:hypothetical protein